MTRRFDPDDPRRDTLARDLDAIFEHNRFLPRPMPQPRRIGKARALLAGGVLVATIMVIGNALRDASHGPAVPSEFRSEAIHQPSKAMATSGGIAGATGSDPVMSPPPVAMLPPIAAPRPTVTERPHRVRLAAVAPVDRRETPLLPRQEEAGPKAEAIPVVPSAEEPFTGTPVATLSAPAVPPPIDVIAPAPPPSPARYGAGDHQAARRLAGIDALRSLRRQ